LDTPGRVFETILLPVRRLVAFVLLLAACATPETPQTAQQKPTLDVAAYQKELDAWKQNRFTRLKAEDGWFTLVGLFWLRPGENTFGSDKSNKIVMPAKAPAKCGLLVLDNGTVTLRPDASAGMTVDGKPVTAPTVLRNDNDEAGPTVVKLGSMQFTIIKRNDRYGVRVKDAESEARKNFAGLEYYPVDPKWRVEARLEPHNPPKKITIQNIIGMVSEETSPGSLVFEVDGKTYRIDPIVEEGSTDYFLIFKDETSGKTTYPAGRYLYAKPAGADGKVIVDFNRAYNPPCAFSDYATCPLPPAQNRLAVALEAGEKNYKLH
jgi:uncharacterized protein